jgi:Major Facilitator Superfamily.
MAGLGSLLWAIIEAPVHGWKALETLVAFAVGILLIIGFLAWEFHTSHPMLQMDFFKKARFSAANASITTVFFALFGSMFMITQYLQFVMGYSPLRAGIMILPVSIVLGLAAPLSISAERKVGTKIIVAIGLLLVSYGLWDMSSLTISSHYSTILIPLVVLGTGMGFAMAPATESIMGSLPPDKAGIGSATNGTMIQVGGSLGVAVLGSVEATRYVDHVNRLMRGHAVPAQAAQAIRSSIGGALAVAHIAGGAIGKALASSAKIGFTNGMSDAVLVGAMVTIVGTLIALLFLPSRAQEIASSAQAVQKNVASIKENSISAPHLPPMEDIESSRSLSDSSTRDTTDQPAHHSQPR